MPEKLITVPNHRRPLPVLALAKPVVILAAQAIRHRLSKTSRIAGRLAPHRIHKTVTIPKVKAIGHKPSGKRSQERSEMPGGSRRTAKMRTPDFVKRVPVGKRPNG